MIKHEKDKLSTIITQIYLLALIFQFDCIFHSIAIHYLIIRFFFLALKERGLFIILLWVSVTFLICHTPRAILNIYEFHCDYMKKSCLGKYSEIETRNVTYLNYEKIYEILLLFMGLNSSLNLKYCC